MARRNRTSRSLWIASFLGAATGAAAVAWMRRRGLVGKPTLHAADMLRSDHEKVKGLFERFEKATDPALKDQLAGDIVTDLEIHEAIEEEIFYPAVRRATRAEDLMDVAEAQHQQANSLIVELQRKRASGKDYDALMTALSDAVREHIAKEESEMLPLAERSNVNFYRLGARMLARKQQLKMKLGYNTAGLRQELRGAFERTERTP
jgi:hemerythrin superfamily protein